MSAVASVRDGPNRSAYGYGTARLFTASGLIGHQTLDTITDFGEA